TSTPRVSRVTLDTKVPRFFVVIGPAVVEDIQRAFVVDPDRRRTGRDCFKYRSMALFSHSGTRRSSGRRDFVRLPGRAIHQMPSISLNVRPISKPAKFFSRIGQSASRAVI